MTITTLQIVWAGGIAALAYNLLTFAVSCFMFYKPGDRISWAKVAFRALVSAIVGGWAALFIAIIVQITF